VTISTPATNSRSQTLTIQIQLPNVEAERVDSVKNAVVNVLNRLLPDEELQVNVALQIRLQPPPSVQPCQALPASERDNKQAE